METSEKGTVHKRGKKTKQALGDGPQEPVSKFYLSCMDGKGKKQGMIK